MSRILAFLLCATMAFGAGITYPPQKNGLVERDVTGTTSTDTILASDCGNPVVYSGSVAVAVTLPTAITLGNVYCAFTLTNQTTGASTAVTVTPTTWSIVPTAAGTIGQSQSCRYTVNQAGNGWTGVCHDLQAAPTFTSLTTTCTGAQTWALASAWVANASITITGSCTLNITNPVTRGNYVLIVTQGSGGSHTLALGTGCTWKVSGGGAGAITPTTTAGAIDVLAFTYDGTNCYANFNKNFN